MSPVDRLLSDVQRVLADLEALAQEAEREAGGDGSAHDVDALRKRITSLRDRMQTIASEFGLQVKERADRYVRGHAWQLLGIAGVFILGLLLRPRD